MKYLLTTTGTGGHLFPAILVADEIKKNSDEVLFGGTFRSGAETLRQKRLDFFEIESIGFNGNPIKIIKFLYLILCGYFIAKKQIRKFKPNAVIGFGGFGSVSIIMAAASLKVPILLHEQNVIPGKATKFLMHWADKVAISFKKTKDFLSHKNCVHVGYPCSKSVEVKDKMPLYMKFRLDENTKTIFVFGGSQGSRIINKTFYEAVRKLQKKCSFQFIHVCGEEDFVFFKELYKMEKVKYSLSKFLSNMNDAYTLADVVISRSGAGTVTEIAMHQKRSILIPYPYAGSHQKENAVVLEEKGVAVVIDEDNLTNQKMTDTILKLLEETQDNGFNQKFSDIYIEDAAKKIFSLAKELI